VTHHPIIDEPEEKYLVDYESQPGLRVPMSLGKLKEDHDNSKICVLTSENEVCKVVDVIINPKVYENVVKDDGLKQFLEELLRNYIH
jgi:hypothetical protein